MNFKNILLFSLFIIFKSYAQFGPQQIIGDEFQVSIVLAADINGDGKIDVLGSGWNAYTIAWYENIDNAGTFGPVNYVTQNLPFSHSFNTADFDGDGDIDVLASSRAEAKVVWYENLDGLGNFSSEKLINDYAPFVKRVLPVDIDNDNDMDVVAAITSANKVVWYENLTGDGNFGGEKVITSNAINVNELDVADINGDNKIDVLANSSSTSVPSWFENIDGQGDFGEERFIDAEGTYKIIPADIDGDGDIDIFIRELNGDDFVFTWHENIDAQGTFLEKQIISNNSLGREISAVDIDNDNDLDLLATFVGEGKIVWFENIDGAGTFGEEQTIDDFAASSVEGVDLDGDGYNDVLTNIDQNLVWYKNLISLGVEENLNSNIIIKNNPVKTNLIIENNTIAQIKTIKIYDVLGRLVLQETEFFTQINVSQLNQGVLLVTIETELGTITKKVIKH